MEKGSEEGDVVTSATTNDRPNKIRLKCRNESLGLAVTKTYRIDADTGWLFKETRIVAPEVSKSFVHMAAHARISPSMWRGAVLHHPAWHSGHNPLVPTNEVDDPVRFRVGDGTGLVCLTHPRRNLTVGTFRFASRGLGRPAGDRGEELSDQRGVLRGRTAQDVVRGPDRGGELSLRRVDL